MRYADIQRYVNHGLGQPDMSGLFRTIQDTAQEYIKTSSAFGGEAQLNYYIATLLSAERPDIDASMCQFSMYDSSGILIYDSKLGSVVDDPGNFVRIPIATQYQARWGPYYDRCLIPIVSYSSLLFPIREDIEM